MTDREEEAFRNALRGLAGDSEVDPVVARRSVAVTQLVMALALVLVLSGAILLPRVLGGGASQAGPAADAGAEAQPGSASAVAESAPGSPVARKQAPPGWRTEYFRDIGFSVPSEWGYAVPPQSDWCANNPAGEPRPDQRRPYVWLAMDIPVPSIKCPDQRPDSLLTEHVLAVAPGPATDYVEGEYQQTGWWIVTRFAGSAVLIVTTQDRELAEQILDSAEVVDDEAAPCQPASPVAGPVGARPETAVPLDDVTSVESAVVCQYEPVRDAADQDLPRLRAVRQLEGEDATRLVDVLRSAPVNDSVCDPSPVDSRPDVSVVVRIATEGRLAEVFVVAAGCPDGPGMAGGIDDGTVVRELTRPACTGILVPPLALFSGTGDVSANCLG